MNVDGGRTETRWRAAAFFVLSMIALLCSSTNCRAQEPTQSQPPAQWHFGYDLFRMLVEEDGLTVTTSLSDVTSDPAQSVLVVVGNIGDRLNPFEVQRFIDRGGAVLLATDQPYRLGRICDFFSPQDPVIGRRSADHYQGHPDCLIVTDLQSQSPVADGIGSLVVNRTGWLRPGRSFPRHWTWTPVARLPNSLRPTYAGRQAVLGQIDGPSSTGGKALLAADPSLLINGMLWHADNALLAINLSRWLTDGRQRVCFLIDGRPAGSYRENPVMNSAVPPPDLPDNLPVPELDAASWLRIANSIVKRVEQSNVFNEILANQPRNVRPPYFRRGILFALAAALILFAIWRLASSGGNTHRPMPVRPMKSAFDLASASKMKSAEFGLSASLLARELCREITGEDSPSQWLRALSVNSVSRQAITHPEAEGRMKTVLELAVNTRTVHISRRRFEQIGRSIQQLRQMHREGRLLQDQQKTGNGAS